MQHVDNTGIFFAMRKPPIYRHRSISLLKNGCLWRTFKKEAKKNGAKDEDIRLIIPDDDDELERKETEEYCTALLMYEKKDGEVYFSRSVKARCILPRNKDTRAKAVPCCRADLGRQKELCTRQRRSAAAYCKPDRTESLACAARYFC